MDSAGPMGAAVQTPPSRPLPSVSDSGSSNDAEKGMQAPVLGPVELKPQPDVVAGEVAGFPRVVAGPAVSPEIAAKINAALAHDEAAAKAAAADCVSQLKETQPSLKAEDLADAWQRSVDVTMRGPRLLSYTMGTSYSCGGAYPEIARSSSIVYDLTTGKPVNWLRMLRRGTKGVRGDLGDGSVAGWLQIPSLQKKAHRDADADCKEVFDSSFGEKVSFEAYPDAREGALVLNTPDIMHARRECETAFSLKETELRNFGAPPELWNAIAAAHAFQPRAKKLAARLR